MSISFFGNSPVADNVDKHAMITKCTSIWTTSIKNIFFPYSTDIIYGSFVRRLAGMNLKEKLRVSKQFPFLFFFIRVIPLCW